MAFALSLGPGAKDRAATLQFIEYLGSIDPDAANIDRCGGLSKILLRPLDHRFQA